MIWAEKLRERTLGSAFAPTEVPELLGVDTKEAGKIINELMKNCWIRFNKSGKFLALKAEQRQEYVKECLGAVEIEIKRKYELFTHLKGLLDESIKESV